jgi:hypothetical protein
MGPWHVYECFGCLSLTAEDQGDLQGLGRSAQGLHHPGGLPDGEWALRVAASDVARTRFEGVHVCPLVCLARRSGR